MTKHLTQGEALEDFLQYIKEQPFWATMKRTEKQYIYKARQAQRNGTLGEARLERLFNKYSPGRYKYQGWAVLVSDTAPDNQGASES